MMRANRLRCLVTAHNNGGFLGYMKACGVMRRWFAKHGLIEEYNDPQHHWWYRLTEKGRESMRRALNEYDAHGNLRCVLTPWEKH